MNGLNDVYVGQTFALVIDNWFQYDNGYTLTFTGTAKIYDDIAPTFSIAAPSCGSNTITITMDELIDCSTLVMAEFILTNTGTSTPYTSDITSVVCGSSDDQIIVTYTAAALPSGPYEFSFVANPSLADDCGNVISNTQTVTFNYQGALTLTPSVATLCSGSSVNLTAGGAPPSTANIYTLTPGGTLASSDGSGNATYSSLSPTTTTTYTVSVIYGGCTNTANTSVNVQDNVIVSISPVDPQICSGTEALTASSTIDGVNCPTCTYVWSTTETTAAITAGPGTYTVQATTPEGCLSQSPDPSSTISLASGTPATCNIYYVDNGVTVRDGLTKTTPTTLADAITKAACTNSILKLGAGVYTLTDRMVVTSFMTIEGGYYNTYANKSSDLSSSGANTTKIRRSSAADSDDANGCTAFKVGNSADGFEFRNLVIELPGCSSGNIAAHANGSQKTNYGIRMGTSCVNYNIVRCFIDAGIGANP
ncbi:MAG: hypothetical protein JKX73_02920 [Flavobacteriales bacterium]|nr:hypothetical protein [Flavobacteriales bacterium]